MTHDGWDGKYELRCKDTNRLYGEGARVASRQSDEMYVIKPGVGAPPHKPSSQGKVWVAPADSKNDSNCMEFYPSVFNLYWRKATDETLPDCGCWVEQTKFVC